MQVLQGTQLVTGVFQQAVQFPRVEACVVGQSVRHPPPRAALPAAPVRSSSSSPSGVRGDWRGMAHAAWFPAAYADGPSSQDRARSGPGRRQASTAIPVPGQDRSARGRRTAQGRSRDRGRLAGLRAADGVGDRRAAPGAGAGPFFAGAMVRPHLFEHLLEGRQHRAAAVASQRGPGLVRKGLPAVRPLCAAVGSGYPGMDVKVAQNPDELSRPGRGRPAAPPGPGRRGTALPATGGRRPGRPVPSGGTGRTGG